MTNTSDPTGFGQSDYKYVPVAKFKDYMQEKLCTQTNEFDKVVSRHAEF